MTAPIDTLHRFDTALRETAPKIASRLQAGLTIADIEAKTASFSWELPQDAYDLYQWHNGLSGQPGKLNLAEKLLRIKGKWHGELSGRENEFHLQLGNRLIVAKFLPLDYALAGHRHLKLGRCSIDLLPFCILTEGKDTIYCMMRLDRDNPILYCANGTNLPPMKVTEAFLSTQPQFNRLSGFMTFLTSCCQQGIEPISSQQASLLNAIDLQLNPVEFKRLYQQQTS
ncbi:hypothetical protein ANSO36C_65980 (plasmid) [Nostoc cf. commune SO-36]|uniref:Uncharacterized protein n=1 Tax=Nostoc cf. commune SO-36 TaxID=449208 RepID=A0ABM7ZBY3_NOSCO|nr:hypothetical protein [Nostoc commune]BDI20796.1 hypothetical protein ANSO36C_65980 [Nostoc cf. commune SO-36]